MHEVIIPEGLDQNEVIGTYLEGIRSFQKYHLSKKLKFDHLVKYIMK